MSRLELLQHKLISNSELKKRREVLWIASLINEDFKNPNICGGFLRDIFLDEEPSDCDVVFEGIQLNQPGIVECVRDAENSLGYLHFDDWEFSNAKAEGVSGDLFDDTIGFFSHHTDYLTLLLYDTDGQLRIGSGKTPEHLATRTYDVRHQGFAIWMGFRRRGYFNTVARVATRGLYLCYRLNLNPTDSAKELFRKFEFHFSKLNLGERKSLMAYWNKKTVNLEGIGDFTSQFGVKSLK
jgi:hypothetical protein